MRRVAVVQNESESLRNQYADVVQKLANIPGLRGYEFRQFDGQNIGRLFASGGQELNAFDSVFITTNATSNQRILAGLVDNRDCLEDFLSQGRGIFIGSQKKLSQVSAPDNSQEPTGTGFLPRHYEISAIQRPQSEPDSGEGVLSLAQDATSPGLRPGDSSIILTHPSAVTIAETIDHCLHNDFQRHFYRSHLSPSSPDYYCPLIVDYSYEIDPIRFLLIGTKTSEFGERILATTIALDWEYHARLMANIVTYISEGAPKFAFVGNMESANGDFGYLVSSARLSGLPHRTYRKILDVPNEMRHVHSTYVLSAESSDTEASQFWQSLTSGGQSLPPSRRHYQRLFKLREADDLLSLAQYSNYSSIDLTISDVMLWIETQFAGRMWHGGFWNTCDVLQVMCILGAEFSSFVPPVLDDIGRHLRDGSYDSVIGATCGLLDLMITIHQSNPSLAASESRILLWATNAARWILSKFPGQSGSSKQTAILTLARYTTYFGDSSFDEVERARLAESRLEVRRNLNEVSGSLFGYAEVDICRMIRLCLEYGTMDVIADRLLGALGASQGINGMWRTPTRTAHVVITLMENLDALTAISGGESTISDMLNAAVLYLRSEYDEVNHNWGGDLQASAKAIHALGLHNMVFRYSTQEFIGSIRQEGDRIDTGLAVQSTRLEMSRMREGLTREKAKVRLLTNDLNVARAAVERKDAGLRKAFRSLTWHRVIATVSLSLLLAIVTSLLASHRPTAKAIVGEVGSLIPLLLGCLVAIGFDLLIKPRQPDVDDN